MHQYFLYNTTNTNSVLTATRKCHLVLSISRSNQELFSFLTVVSYCFLLKLLDTKSTDRKQTLLHFIVSIIQDKYPEVQSFYSELHFLDKAALGKHNTAPSAASHFLLPPSPPFLHQ